MDIYVLDDNFSGDGANFSEGFISDNDADDRNIYSELFPKDLHLFQRISYNNGRNMHGMETGFHGELWVAFCLEFFMSLLWLVRDEQCEGWLCNSY